MLPTNSDFTRSIGILLHPTALPNDSICGTFGASSRNWLHILADNGIGVWQFLPLCPPDSTGSPYSSPSGFALNPWFLDAEDLVKDGFLSESELNELPGSLKYKSDSLDFALANSRTSKIGSFLKNNWNNQSLEIHSEFLDWSSKQDWLEDYVSFMELRSQFDQLPWWEWPQGFAQHDEITLNDWKSSWQENLLEHRLLQWHLDRQWQLIRQTAKELGVLLFGDMPFYVSRDSADVWGNRELFSITSKGELEVQSGVPPDYFSSTGQLWGTPVYLWERHFENQFSWWRKRFERQWHQVDLLRLDHFRALISFWAVPGDDKTAEEGEWITSPGKFLLQLLEKDYKGQLDLVAEDLGIITDEVDQLRDEFNLPGMKVLQFAFNGEKDNPYLPENIIGNSWVVYSGTHDNPTTLSWWDSLEDKDKDYINEEYFDDTKNPSWNIIEIGMSTQAKLFIAPLQDILNLDDKARFNKPGTVGHNWVWRQEKFDGHLIQSLQKYGKRGLHWGRSFEDTFNLIKAF